MTEREKLIELLGGEYGFTEEDNDTLEMPKYVK